MTRAVGSPREGVSLWLRAVSRCCFLARDLAREDQSLTVAPPPTHLPQGHLELHVNPVSSSALPVSKPQGPVKTGGLGCLER